MQCGRIVIAATSSRSSRYPCDTGQLPEARLRWARAYADTGLDVDVDVDVNADRCRKKAAKLDVWYGRWKLRRSRHEDRRRRVEKGLERRGRREAFYVWKLYHLCTFLDQCSTARLKAMVVQPPDGHGLSARGDDPVG